MCYLFDACLLSAVSNPIPSNLKSEAKKAARILKDFTEISNRNGPDKLIPGEKNNKRLKKKKKIPNLYTVVWFTRLDNIMVFVSIY